MFKFKDLEAGFDVGKELTKEEVDFLRLFSGAVSYDKGYSNNILSLYEDSVQLLKELKQKGFNLSKYKSVNIKQLIGEIFILSITDVIPGTNFFEEFEHGFDYIKNRIEFQRYMEIKRNRVFADIDSERALDNCETWLTKEDVRAIKKSPLGKWDAIMLKYIEKLVNVDESLAGKLAPLYEKLCLTLEFNNRGNKALDRYPRKALVGEMALVSALRKENLFEKLKTDGYKPVEEILMSERQKEQGLKGGKFKSKLRLREMDSVRLFEIMDKNREEKLLLEKGNEDKDK